MDPDFTALASRVAAMAEVLGCVILSRDGLVLGSFPPNGEQDITPGLLRFAGLGDPDRGFVQFADELWAYVREGSYAAFAVAEAGTRPGILIDHLEQALVVAEEARRSGIAMGEPAHVDLSKKGFGRRLRASAPAVDQDLRAPVSAPARIPGPGPGHNDPPVEPPPRREAPAVEDSVLDEALAAAAAAAAAQEPEPVAEQPVPSLEVVPQQPEPPALGPTPEPAPAPANPGPPAPAEPVFGSVEVSEPGQVGGPPGPPPPHPPRSEEIDRVALAREFAQLLQEGPATAE